MQKQGIQANIEYENTKEKNAELMLAIQLVKKDETLVARLESESGSKSVTSTKQIYREVLAADKKRN